MHSGEEVKRKVQQQFGRAASAYGTSDVHAKGESLGLLVELLEPKPTWRVLDVATGTGHTAMAFAPHVALVVALDLTAAMLEEGRSLAAAQGLSNVEWRRGDAESLPFGDHAFDAVTCRLALHHFPHPERALAEMARVVKLGGRLGLTDNIVVPDAAAAAYYNEYERLRDPSHIEVKSLPALMDLCEVAGFEIEDTRELSKEFEFHAWADRQRVSPTDKEKLLEKMRQIPKALEPLFAPRWEGGTMYFHLWEAVVVGVRRPYPTLASDS